MYDISIMIWAIRVVLASGDGNRHNAIFIEVYMVGLEWLMHYIEYINMNIMIHVVRIELWHQKYKSLGFIVIGTVHFRYLAVYFLKQNQKTAP